MKPSPRGVVASGLEQSRNFVLRGVRLVRHERGALREVEPDARALHGAHADGRAGRTARGNRRARSPGEEIKRRSDRGFARVAERSGEIIPGPAGVRHFAGEPIEVFAAPACVDGLEGHGPYAQIAFGTIERELANANGLTQGESE